jgi:protein-S-isoprenylcysteine O-methyltransferase Ste14
MAGRHEHLTGEHRFGDAGQVILAVIFLVLWAGDSFWWRWSTSIADLIPAYVRIPFGIAIAFVGGYFAKTSHDIVFRASGEVQVYRSSVFGMVRHPMYLGAILFYVGLVVSTASLLALGILVVICAFYHFISRYEERLLVARFGDEYRRYQVSVPMWVPLVRILKV